jgi:hypothetical protein
MTDTDLTFVTPYWGGREMMRIHLASLRRFHPGSRILISKKGGGREEMEQHRAEFGIEYWMEDFHYADALLRLLDRCRSRYVCITDHDTVLLSSLDPYVALIASDACDLVGIEERIRECPGVDWRRLAPAYNGWMRFEPGYVDATLLLFDLSRFKQRWGLRGVRGRRHKIGYNIEYHYGICERLPRHH